MRRYIGLLVVVFLLLGPFSLFASGKTEEKKAETAAAAGAEITTAGKVLFYATLAEYEKATESKLTKGNARDCP